MARDPRYRLRALELDNERLRQKLGEVLEQNAELSRQLHKAIDQLATANDRIEELLALIERNAAAKRKPTPTKAPEAPPHLSDESRKAYDARPIPPPLPPRPDKTKTAYHRTGRNALPDHLIAEQSVVRPDTC